MVEPPQKIRWLAIPVYAALDKHAFPTRTNARRVDRVNTPPPLEQNRVLPAHPENGGARAKRASLDEDSSDESREMATDIMATSTTKLNFSMLFDSLVLLLLH